MRNLIYKESNGLFIFEKYFLKISVFAIGISIILGNIFIIYNSTINIGLAIIDIVIIMILLIIISQIIGRQQFQIFEDGFIPYKVPKNRRRPKEKHFISVEEIDKMDLVILKPGRDERNYVEIFLKDGNDFAIFQGHVKSRGLEELMKFKEMHGIKGERRQWHPIRGWIKDDEIERIKKISKDKHTDTSQ
jgi:hypothetical protein